MQNEEVATPITSTLQQAVDRSAEARFLHRLHAVLLVDRGLSCRAAALALGCAPRTVSDWVRRFRRVGPDGLRDARMPGRRPRLTAVHLAEARALLAQSVDERGRPLLNGRALADWLAQTHHVHLGIRQCQRLVARLLIEQRDTSRH